jgi:hypothetical protein
MNLARLSCDSGKQKDAETYLRRMLQFNPPAGCPRDAAPARRCTRLLRTVAINSYSRELTEKRQGLFIGAKQRAVLFPEDSRARQNCWDRARPPFSDVPGGRAHSQPQYFKTSWEARLRPRVNKEVLSRQKEGSPTGSPSFSLRGVGVKRQSGSRTVAGACRPERPEPSRLRYR